MTEVERDVNQANVGKLLQKQGYELEYECTDLGDRKQVWLNKKSGMAVRIEWWKMEKVIP